MISASRVSRVRRDARLWFGLLVLLALPVRADAPAESQAPILVPGESGAPHFETEAIDTVEVGPFSHSGGVLPPGWEPLEFEGIPAHTRYSMDRNGKGAPWVVRAQSEAAASGLIRKVDLDLAQFPIVRWRWRIENLIEASNPARKSGDDYAARLYVAFAYQPDRVGLLRRATYQTAQALFGALPFSAITYLWATDTPVGTVVNNAYAGSFVKMIVVESGPGRVGQWVEEERNVLDDYRRAFGVDPPRVEGVAIMTDTDDTEERVVAEYGDIVFYAIEPRRDIAPFDPPSIPSVADAGDDGKAR